MNVDFSVLNQKGSPALYASSLATRPAAGFVGRLFIDTDTPSTGIYRDSGSSWISLSGGGGGGGITGSGTANKLPMFTGSSSIGNSALSYVAGGIGLAPSLSLDTNYNFTCNFTGSAAQPIGFYIYEGVATGFNFQRVVGTPNYNSIYSGNSDMEFKLFDGSTDYYHRFLKNGRVVINGTTDPGFQFRVNGTTNLNGNTTQTGTLTATDTISTGGGGVIAAISYSASTGIMGTSSNHSVDFRTNNTNAMRLTNSTNRLLINTTTDAGAYNLQVSGTSYFAGNIRPDTQANNRNIGGSGFAFNQIYSRNLQLGGAGACTIYAGSFGDVHASITTNNNLMICAGNNNTTEIFSGAGLQFNFTTKGVMLPRLTTAQRNALATTNGLMVYDTDLSHICFYDTSGTPGWRKLSYSNA